MTNDKPRQNGDMDHPEQYKTKKESLLDQFESEQNVDPIPMQDLKEEMREEDREHHTKQHSSSDDKYHTGFGENPNHD